MKMMAIYDKALGAYMQPWFAQSTGQAQRMFTDEINRPDGDMHKHPEDYNLYYLGDWNNETGMIEHDDGHKQYDTQPALIVQGANCIVKQ